MAFITLAGTLRDPTSELAVGDQIRFTHKSTTGETVEGAVSILTIDPSGTYSKDLQYGLVLVEYKDVRTSQFKNLGVATVNGSNPATSIPELLNALVPVSSAELIEFQAILADAVTARNEAEAFANSIDLINDLSQTYIFDTVAAYKASAIIFPGGKAVHLNDRDADFAVIAGTGTGNDLDIIASTIISQSLSLLNNLSIKLKALGAESASPDVADTIERGLAITKDLIVDDVYTSSALPRITLTSDFKLTILNGCSINFSGDVVASYFPYAVDIDANGFDFELSGGGSIDWVDWNPAILRRRLFNVDTAKKATIKNINTKSAKIIVQGDHVTFKNIFVDAPISTLQQSDGTGMLSLDSKYGGKFDNNVIKANVQGFFDICKVAGGSDQYGASVTGNYTENYSTELQADFDVYNGAQGMTFTGNTLINVGLHSKSSKGFDTESPNNIMIDVSMNKFYSRGNAIKYFIYRRSGFIDISRNKFTAESDNNNIMYIIYFDQETSDTSGVDYDSYLYQQNSIIVDKNIVDMRKVVQASVSNTFVFVFTDILTGSNGKDVEASISGNILTGVSGIVRGALFLGATCRDNTIDFYNKTLYSSGNFAAKFIDNLIMKGLPYINTIADTVKNSPNVSCRDYYAESQIVDTDVIDIKSRDITILTAVNTESITAFGGLTGFSMTTFRLLNLTGSTITIPLPGGGTISINNGVTKVITPYNNTNFTQARIRFLVSDLIISNS